jgi:hypothetical protein
MRPTNPLKKNDNLYANTFARSSYRRGFEFSAALPSLRNNRAALASLKN